MTIKLFVLVMLVVALLVSGCVTKNSGETCLRNQTNTKWIDACCVKSNKTLKMNETYETSATLLMDEKFDMLMKTQIGKNATSVLNLTSPNQTQFGSLLLCIDGFNTSEFDGMVIDGQRIDAEKCSQTPKEISVKVKCQGVTYDFPFP